MGIIPPKLNLTGFAELLFSTWHTTTNNTQFIADFGAGEIPVCFLCNKQVSIAPLLHARLSQNCSLETDDKDLPQAMSVAEIAERMHLHTKCAGRKWHVQATCVPTGDGLNDALDWICSATEGN